MKICCMPKHSIGKSEEQKAKFHERLKKDLNPAMKEVLFLKGFIASSLKCRDKQKIVPTKKSTDLN